MIQCRKTNHRISLLALCIVLLLSISSTIQSEPVILFSKQYVNWAWGYSHTGWIIKNDGTIAKSTFRLVDSIWTITNDSVITTSEMHKLDSLSTKTELSVSADTLALMSALSSQLNLEDVTWVDGGHRDFGSICFIAYVYDSSKSGYLEIPLSGYGDSMPVNKSAAATTLAAWLLGINSTIAQTTRVVSSDHNHIANKVSLANNNSMINKRSIVDFSGRSITTRNALSSMVVIDNSQYNQTKKFMSLEK